MAVTVTLDSGMVTTVADTAVLAIAASEGSMVHLSKTMPEAGSFATIIACAPFR